MNKSESVINNISNSLDLNLSLKYMENKNQINEFLEPNLKHNWIIDFKALCLLKFYVF